MSLVDVYVCASFQHAIAHLLDHLRGLFAQQIDGFIERVVLMGIEDHVSDLDQAAVLLQGCSHVGHGQRLRRRRHTFSQGDWSVRQCVVAAEFLYLRRVAGQRLGLAKLLQNQVRDTSFKKLFFRVCGGTG